MPSSIPRLLPPMALLLFAGACSDPATLERGTLEPERQRPEDAVLLGEAERYTGDNPIVLEAQEQLYNGFALHSEVVYPTCGPIGGVCHNAKEYPALHTPANFLGAIGAPCNVQPGSYLAVYDRCERPGDRFAFSDDGVELEVAYIEYVPGVRENPDDKPGADSPGLHIYLAGQLGWERESNYGTGRLVRTFINDAGEVQDLPFFTYDSRYWVVNEAGYEFNEGEQGTHLMAQVAEYQSRQIEQLLAVGLVEGDQNRNGIMGARQDMPEIAMIKPGLPQESYLVARMFGTMQGELIPGSRMPLANEPLSNSEMLGLFCYIEGLPPDGSPVDLQSPIDYGRCSYSARPEELERLGAGATWQGRIKRILDFNCGGCHGGSAPMAGLNLKDGDVYERLLQPSSQRPELKLVEPAQPNLSYLWLKLEGDPSIVGASMPIDPLNGGGKLTTQELADMRTWIEEGALPDGDEPEPVPTPDPDSDAGI